MGQKTHDENENELNQNFGLKSCCHIAFWPQCILENFNSLILYWVC